MTGSTGASIPGAGVPPESEGIILQRGGEEMLLDKVDDRFTVRLVEGRSIAAVAQQVSANAVQSVPTVQLFELVVDPQQLESAMQTARNSPDVCFASHVYQVHGGAALVYLADEITIQFANSVTAESVSTIATSLGLELEKPIAGIPQAFVFRVTTRSTANPIRLANQLTRHSEVLMAEPNIAVHTQLHYRPSDPQYPNQWYLYHNGGADLAPKSHIFAEPAWDITRGARSVVVAVTDDGFDLNHPDFQGKGKIVAPRDFKGRDIIPMPQAPQENHGTACAGVAIAEENGIGIVGVAPGCSFMPLRTTGFLDDTAIEDLFNWAIEKGASVISCSWGPSAVRFSLSLRQRAVLTRAATEGRNGKGCVVLFASGNANRPVNGTVNEQGWTNDVLKGPTTWMSGFAVHPDVIAVSACTSLNKKAAYSNWGEAISVTAPSNNAPPGMWLQQTGYVNTAPAIRGNLPGRGVTTADRLGSSGYDPGSFTSTFGGTSSATPVVAGVAALVLSANPNLTAKEVRQILETTADKIVDADPDPQLGIKGGIYDSKGHSLWFGYGKVNAYRAVQAAQQRLTQPAAPSRWVQQRNDTAIDIPDFNLRGVTSVIQINDNSPVRDIQVSVDVEHTYLGDLELYLISPRGTTLLLQSRTLGRATQLQTTYAIATTPLLRQLINQPASGRWQLQLIDFAQLNTGRLRNWQLNLGL